MSNHVFFHNHSIHLASYAADTIYGMCEQPSGNQSGKTWSLDLGDAALIGCFTDNVIKSVIL